MQILRKLCSNVTFIMTQLSMDRNIVVCVFVLLISNLCVRAHDDDYWDGDWDENKNCEKEEKITKLLQEQNPARCAMRSKGNQMHIQSHLYSFRAFVLEISSWHSPRVLNCRNIQD